MIQDQGTAGLNISTYLKLLQYIKEIQKLNSSTVYLIDLNIVKFLMTKLIDLTSRVLFNCGHRGTAKFTSFREKTRF